MFSLLVTSVLLIPLALFAAAQGGVIFGTAFVALFYLRTSHWLAKIGAMALSYVAWIAFTLGAYTALGGDGGIMDGFMIVLILCVTATFSTAVYLAGWLAAPFFFRGRTRGSGTPTLANPWG